MNPVEAYYDEKVEHEWQRLERHRTEFAVTMQVLKDHLPPPPATILDIGGGPGRYAIALADQGYAVTLVDLSSKNIAFARAKAAEMGVELADTVQANALDLSILGKREYDSVLMLGPLYHLLTSAERLQAVTEARQRLKIDAPFFAAFISRFAAFRDAAKRDPHWVIRQPAYIADLLATGRHTQIGADVMNRFTNAYFAHPSEIEPLMQKAGLTIKTVVGCEGVVAGNEEAVNALTGDDWQMWVDLNYQIGQDPTSHGAADHLLYVGVKA
ncbi:MAG: class I SAM-dependent methyltransferase [Chloroflexota bacterium]